LGARGRQQVTIRVDASQKPGQFKPIYAYRAASATCAPRHAPLPIPLPALREVAAVSLHAVLDVGKRSELAEGSVVSLRPAS
ncbi:MAG TPA: hypothetical protein VG498_16605, partial [Terriglobales bacterium]|nr:hypothetical protein [Terriglobales bacterium]